MTAKILGALLIVAGCGWVGFAMAASVRQEKAALQQLLQVLEFMKNELAFRLPPLPELCTAAAAQSSGVIAAVLNELAAQLDKQLCDRAEAAMEAVLDQTAKLSVRVRQNLRRLGTSLGRFDLQGQLSSLEAAAEICRQDLEAIQSHEEERVRSCRTLGLCAGAALAILLI